MQTDRPAGQAPVVARFVGFETAQTHLLRAQFDVTADGVTFRATVDLSPDGRVLDLQASDCFTPGTTGRPAVDALLRQEAFQAMTWARAVASYSEWSRRRDRDRSSYPGRRRARR